MKFDIRIIIREHVPYLLIVLVFTALYLTGCSTAVQNNNSGYSVKPVQSFASAGESENMTGPDQNSTSSNGDTIRNNPAPTISAEEMLSQQIQGKLSDMTLEEKVAQIFMITPEALTEYQTVTDAEDITRDALEAYPVGGLIYFGANIVNPDQLKAMTGNTQKFADEIEGMPLFLAIDEEGGRVARIGNNSNFDVKKYTDMASIGATKDPDKAYEAGTVIGAYLKEYGFNLDFAPDADVLTNPNNSVIGDRSFGSEGALVADMDISFAKGLQVNEVLSCFKHFPGHGATEGDTHEGFAYTNKTLDELMENELIPFRAAAEHEIPFIMISHISVPNVIGDNTPSSLSKIVVTDILRTQLGYQGIIITDSLSMGAIMNQYGAEEAVLQAIEAGADMILMPQDFKSAYQGVLDAVAEGTISEQRINESVERILKVKFGMES